MLGLLPGAASRSPGRSRFDGADLLTLPEDELRALRGRDIAMVFQDPMSSLNPVLTVGRQITEVLERHRGLKGEDARDRGRRAARQRRHPRRRRRLRSTRTSSPAACASA